MEKGPEEVNYQALNHPSNFGLLEYSLEQHHHQQHPLKPRENSEDNIEMVDFMLNGHPPPPPPALSLDKLSFADVMQFADFGPKLALTHSKIPEEDNYFLRFPVLSEKLHEDHLMAPPPHLPPPRLPPPAVNGEDGFNRMSVELDEEGEEGDPEEGDEHEPRCSENASSVQQVPFLGGGLPAAGSVEVKNRRKRPRTMKTTEEVESQRMTHIAVERNRRKQMNEHLRVLRSLMPGSYVQRGDQASIIGGAIEFVRELEQLLQCLESQKRRRLYGSEAPRSMTDVPPPPPLGIQQTNQQPFFPQSPLPNNDQMKQLLEFETCGLREETAENKSSLADIEVKLLGFDAMIKILSRRQPGQLLRTIAALEELQLNILHTNITTIEQTVLYSFNVKIMGETRFTAEDIANSVQQIFHFISASTI